MNQKVDPATIKQRFQSLEQLVGEGIASDAVRKEPILLLWDSESLRGTWQYLKGLEDGAGPQVADIFLKNPKVLTISVGEMQRTKTSLSGLAPAAAAIDFLRPLGPLGVPIALVVGFTFLILVLRPILYGVGGGPSLISAITSPIIGGGTLSIPRPYEFFESFGINLSAVVAIIPVYQVGKSILNKIESDQAAAAEAGAAK